MRVITFSQTFPTYHPRRGEPTGFVEKILNGQKVHTIRAGHRWKAGDWFNPRVWSGKPYTSKQITFAPDIQVKKVWNIQRDDYGIFSIEGKDIYGIDTLAKNDGLTTDDLWRWIKWPMEGQIICWSDEIKY
jgi:hypothetical protein